MFLLFSHRGLGDKSGASWGVSRSLPHAQNGNRRRFNFPLSFNLTARMSVCRSNYREQWQQKWEKIIDFLLIQFVILAGIFISNYIFPSPGRGVSRGPSENYCIGGWTESISGAARGIGDNWRLASRPSTQISSGEKFALKYRTGWMTKRCFPSET